MQVRRRIGSGFSPVCTVMQSARRHGRIFTLLVCSFSASVEVPTYSVGPSSTHFIRFHFLIKPMALYIHVLMWQPCAAVLSCPPLRGSSSSSQPPVFHPDDSCIRLRRLGSLAWLEFTSTCRVETAEPWPNGSCTCVRRRGSLAWLEASCRGVVRLP